MNSRRTLKAASAIREVVGTAILTELRDPRIEDVTVTFVEISGDMRNAKVHVSIMGDEKKQDLCMHGLNSSVGYLQRKIGDRIETRYTPRIKFVLDKGIKNSFRVAAILDDVLPSDEQESDESDVVDDVQTELDDRSAPVDSDPAENTE